MRSPIRRSWAIAICVIAVGIGCWIWNRPKPAESPGDDGSSPRSDPSASASGQGEASRPLHRANERKPQPPLPPRLAGLLDLTVIEEDTGEISPLFFKYFDVPAAGRDQVKGLIIRAIEDFKEVEVRHARLVSTPDDYYIRLADCSEEAGPIFDDLARQLASPLGTEAAQSIRKLLHKQFRNGGETPMEIGVVQTPQGEYLLSKRTFGSSGALIGHSESRYLVTGKYSELARWRNLDRITQADAAPADEIPAR